MQYRLTDAAKADVREMVQWIRWEQKSPQNARLVANRLKAQITRLVEMPRLGHAREDLNDTRALVIEVTGLLVIYDPSLKPLTIRRVVARGEAWLELRPAEERAFDLLSNQSSGGSFDMIGTTAVSARRRSATTRSDGERSTTAGDEHRPRLPQARRAACHRKAPATVPATFSDK